MTHDDNKEVTTTCLKMAMRWNGPVTTWYWCGSMTFPSPSPFPLPSLYHPPSLTIPSPSPFPLPSPWSLASNVFKSFYVVIKYISIVPVQTYFSQLVSILNTSWFKFSWIWVESIWSICRLHIDSSWMIQKYTDLVVFQVDSIWTPGIQVESNCSMWGSVKYTQFLSCRWWWPSTGCKSQYLCWKHCKVMVKKS